MKPTTATLLTGLLLITMSANAEIKPGTHQVGISVGAANPLSYHAVDGERAEFGSVGPTLGFSYLYQVRPTLSLGADLNFKRLGDKDLRTGQGPVTVESSAWTLLAIGRGDILPDSDLRPYGLLGLGLGGVKREIRYSASPRLDRDQTSGGFAAAVGAGLDFDISASWLAGAELRWNYINTEASEVGTGSVRTLDLQFKAGYKF